MRRQNNHQIPAESGSLDTGVNGGLDRRGFIRIGGLTIATGALVAACVEPADQGIARVGNAPTTTALPDASVNDGVLLRTAASMERSISAVYDWALATEGLTDPEFEDIFKRFSADHITAAKAVDVLTATAGDVAWDCGNPRFDTVIIGPLQDRIEASDDPERDVKNLLNTLETVLAAMHQSFVAQLSQPALRSGSMAIGADSSRRSAVLAMRMSPRPGSYVSVDDLANAVPDLPETTVAPTTTQNLATQTTLAGEAVEEAPAATPIPQAYAVPHQFGQLGATQVVLGAPNEAGTRLTANLETPSLNSFVYDFTEPHC